MADGDIGSVQDTLEFDTAFANYLKILKHSASIAVIFYGNSSSNQQVVTVEVDSAGAITNTVKDSLAFNGAWAGFLSMAWRSTGILVLAGRMDLDGLPYETWVASVTVGDAGELPAAIIDSLKVTTSSNDATAVVHLQGNYMVMAQNDDSSHGWLHTFTCSTLGAISNALVDSYEFDATQADNIRMIKVSDTVVAVVFKDSASDGWVKTFTIDGSGNITASATDSFEFETTLVYHPDICHLVDDVYVIAWRDGDLDGQMCTIDIDSSGNIGAAALDTWEYNTVQASQPIMVKVSDGIIALVYSDVDGDGRVTTIAIDAAGAITKAAIDELEYETDWNNFPCLAHMTGNIYLIANQGTDNDGFVRSVDIETPTAARPNELMTMGVG